MPAMPPLIVPVVGAGFAVIASLIRKTTVVTGDNAPAGMQTGG